MTGLPLGWIETKLPSVCTKITDGTHHSPVNLPSGDFPYVTAKNIRKWGLDLSNITYVDAVTHREIYARCPPEKGDVLYIKDGATTGLAIVNPLDAPFSMLSSVALIKPDHAVIEPEYLKNWLNSPSTLESMLGQMTGTAIRRLTLTTISAQEIPLPPLPEQRRIVRKLDTLSARSTTARTHLTAIEKLVERYKLAVLSGSLFRNGTPVKRLGEVLTDIRYGTAAKCSYDPSGTPVLRIPNIQSGRIDRTDLKSAHFAKKEIEQLALKAGDILVIRSNGSPDLVGRVALVTDGETDCLFAGYLIRLRLSAPEALPEYVRLCFESDEVRAIIEAASKSTSGVNNVNSTQLKEIALPMPPVDEQREIVRRIETAFAKIDLLAAEAAKALKLLGHLDQRILAKAFAGDLVPQDPTDEPAETLLARIREARATAPKGKRRRTSVTG